MKAKLIKLLKLEKERDKYVVEHDYWFRILHEFWLEHRIQYMNVPDHGFFENGQMDCNEVMTYFTWADYPKQWELWNGNLEYYRGKANEVRLKIKEIELGMSDYELSLLCYGWEDKFCDNWETFLN